MSDDEDYRLQHRAPTGEDDVGAPMHDIESVLPNVHERPELYRYGSPGEDESLHHIRRVRGKPEAKVRIYRALPAEHVHKGIQTGDWVSPSKEYARQHGRQYSETGHDDWPVISTTVPAKHLFNEGYPTEFGYDGPAKEASSVAFKGGKNQEVRQHADGVVRKVVRQENPVKGYSFTHEDHRDYDEHMSGAAPHGVVRAWDPHGDSAGHIKFGPEGHEVHIEPEHQHVADELERRMRRRMPKESSVQRVAVLQGFAHLPDEQPDAFARRTASSGPKITVVAHVSGNSIDVMHCPFCGSGALVARSDGTIECFSGETRYMTYDGVKTLAETAGTTQRVLTNGVAGGDWVDAEIQAFGVRELYRVTVRRNKITRDIYATEGHRWFYRNGHGGARQEATTLGLKSGMVFESVVPASRISRSFPSPFGIAHGVVYGDGSICGTQAQVQLWGEKDAQLLGYFIGHPNSPIKLKDSGLIGVQVRGLPRYFKSRPSLDEATPYLYGWLAGYFAADGTVSRQGQAKLSSADRTSLEFVQTLCHRLGIASYPIQTVSRIGRSGSVPAAEATDLFTMEFVGSTLRSEFFLIAEHRLRYESKVARGASERLRWTVVSVEKTDRTEQVYCAVVPKTHAFALEDNLLTGNCNFCTSVFTVQVQPQFAAFPQTAEGTPYQWPGQPGPEQLAGGGSGAMGGFPGPVAGEEDPEAEGGDDNPFADGESDDSDGGPEGAADDSDGGGKAQVGGKDAPPFGKKKKSSLLYRTAAGHLLDEAGYLQHLAISHARNRGAVARVIRESR